MAVAGENLVAAVRDWQIDDLKLDYRNRASIAVRTMAGANAHAIQLGARLDVLKKSFEDEVRTFAVVKPPGEGQR